MKLAEKIFKVVSLIPMGKIMTYGQVAKLVGTNPRVVGNILHKNLDPDKIPCHRVVNAKGEVSKNYVFGGEKMQKDKLGKEGIEFIQGKINIKKYLKNTL